jgi:ankyrin repeat protein
MAVNGHLYLLNDVFQFSGDTIDMNKEDSEGSTAFILAIKNKRIEFVKFLLANP